MRIGDAILCRRNMLAIGLLSPIYDSQLDDNFNDVNNLSFKYYRTDDNGELYDRLIDLELVYIPTHKKYYEIGVQENEDDHGVYKTVTGISLCEAELGQIILRNLEFNTELDIKRPDYRPAKIYDNTNPDTIQNSIMVRILKDKAPHYKLKHIDNSIGQLQRTFSIDGQSIVDFLRSTLAPEVHCTVEFGVESDTKDRTISLYDMYDVCNECGYRAENFKINYKGKCPKCGSIHYKKGYGEDTNIVVSTENLAESISVQTNKDNVKNCFYVTGGDDLLTNMVAAVNPNGTNYIWRFSEEQLADMSNELSSKLRDYNALYEERQPDYKDVMVHIYDILDQKSEINYGKVEYPSTNDSDCNTELQKILDEFQKELFKISVQSLKTASKTIVSNAITQYARIFLSTGYSVKVLEGNTYDDDTHKWCGILRVYKTTNDENFSDSPILTINVDDDYLNFLEQKIGKTLHQYDINNTKTEPDWTQYPLSILSSFESAYQACLDVLIEQGCGNSNNACYSLYKEYYDWHTHITERIKVLEEEIARLDAELKEYEEQKIEIQDILNIENYLGTDLWHELIAYRREDEYNNPNFISDGIVRNEEMLSKAEELFNMANDELKKACQTQYTVSSNLINFLEIPEFKAFADQCKLGNWIYIQTKYRDIYKLSIMNITYTDEIDKNLSVTFSNAYKPHTEINAVDDILKESQSMATSYDSTKYQAAAGKLASDDISAWVKEGLDASLYLIKNNNAEEVTLDNSGLVCKSYDDVTDDYSSEQVKVTHNVLAFTKDNWETVSTALGKCTYHKYNEEENQFETNEGYGLTSEFVQSGYVTGSQIIGGDIYSPNYIPKQKGTHIGLENAEFEFNGDGSGSQLLLTHEKVGDTDKLMLQMLKGDVIAGRIYSTDYSDMPKDNEGNPIGTPMTSIDLNKGNFSFAKGDMVYEYDEQNENKYITFTKGGFQVKPSNDSPISSGVFDEKGIDLHNNTNSHLGYFYLGSQGYTLDLGYDFENRESTNNSDYNIMQFLYNSDSLDVDAPSIRMRTPMIKEAEHNPRTQSELWYGGLDIQGVKHSENGYIYDDSKPSVHITNEHISLNNGANVSGGLSVVPSTDDEGVENADTSYIKTKDGLIADYDSISDKSVMLHCDSAGTAHIGVIPGDATTSNQVADAEILITGNEGRIVDKYGNLIPFYASNLDTSNNYSYEETKVGKWTDGRDLYQITKHFGNMPNSQELSVAHKIDLEEVVEMSGYFYNANIEENREFYPIPNISYKDSVLEVDSLKITTDNMIINSNTDRSSYDAYLTFRYLKSAIPYHRELLYLSSIAAGGNVWAKTDYIPNKDTVIFIRGNGHVDSQKTILSFGGSTYDTEVDSISVWGYRGYTNKWLCYWRKGVQQGTYNASAGGVSGKAMYYNFPSVWGVFKFSDTSMSFSGIEGNYNYSNTFESIGFDTVNKELFLFYGGDSSSINFSQVLIYEGDTLVRDYVPSFDKKGNLLLYDNVHNNLTPITGSGINNVTYEYKTRYDLSNFSLNYWIPISDKITNSYNEQTKTNHIIVNSVDTNAGDSPYRKLYLRRSSLNESMDGYNYSTQARNIVVEFSVRSLNKVNKKIDSYKQASIYTIIDNQSQFSNKYLEENPIIGGLSISSEIELNGDGAWKEYSITATDTNYVYNLGKYYTIVIDFSNIADGETAELEIKDFRITGSIW